MHEGLWWAPPWAPPEAPFSSPLQLAIVGASLACHAASSHLATLAGEVTDHFHRGRFRGSLDLSLAASWNQVWQGIEVGPCPVTLSKGRGHTHSRRFQTRDLFHIERKCLELEDEG